MLRSLASYLSHARWMNPLAGSQLRRCKPYQLRLALQVGMTVPRTTITNNPAAVQRIFDEVDHGRVIFKTLSPLIVSEDKQVYTTEITKEFPSVSRATMVQCPAIYQELVERRSDLRITIVGRKVFAVRISSQTLDEEKDRLDWRRCQEKDELYSEAQVCYNSDFILLPQLAGSGRLEHSFLQFFLPTDIFFCQQISESFKERLLDYHERAGLVFAAYDFLERGDDVIFLECNAAGAWLWLEQRLGLKVSEHIARYLLGID